MLALGTGKQLHNCGLPLIQLWGALSSPLYQTVKMDHCPDNEGIWSYCFENVLIFFSNRINENPTMTRCDVGGSLLKHLHLTHINYLHWQFPTIEVRKYVLATKWLSPSQTFLHGALSKKKFGRPSCKVINTAKPSGDLSHFDISLSQTMCSGLAADVRPLFVLAFDCGTTDRTQLSFGKRYSMLWTYLKSIVSSFCNSRAHHTRTVLPSIWCITHCRMSLSIYKWTRQCDFSWSLHTENRIEWNLLKLYCVELN